MRRWTLRDGLTLFAEILRDQATRDFEHDEVMWALIAPHQDTKHRQKAPTPPEILR